MLSARSRVWCKTRPESNNIKTINHISRYVSQVVADITGCVELTDRVDMAASAYSESSHLLCHDDVIGTRAVSFIVYLTDDQW